MQGGLRRGDDLDVLVARDAGDLVGREIAGDVGVTLLDQEALGRRAPARDG